MALTRKFAWLLMGGLALLALILLAAALPGLQFRAGQRFVVAEKDSGGETAAESSEFAGPEIMVTPAAGLSVGYVILMVLLPAAVIYLIVSPKARKQILRRLIPFLGVAALFLLLRQHPEVLSPADQEVPSIAGTAVPPAGRVVSFDATPPAWLHWTVTVGVALALALAAGVAVWLYRRRLQRRAGPLERLAEEAQSALAALRAGGDVRDTILSCYFEMSQVLSRERSLTRQQAMTPREFEEGLAQAGLPEAPVRRLTRLFERVRYGAKAAAQGEEQEALACLAEVVQACRQGAPQVQPAFEDADDPDVTGEGSFIPSPPA